MLAPDRNGVPGGSAGVVEHLGIRVDHVQHRAFCAGRELRLTVTEFRLLAFLLAHPGRAFARRQLVEAAIRGGAVVLDRTIDVHVKALRRKLGQPDLIETVRGIGYRLCASLPPAPPG